MCTMTSASVTVYGGSKESSVVRTTSVLQYAKRSTSHVSAKGMYEAY